MSKLDELEKYGTPAEEIAMLRDKIKEIEIECSELNEELIRVMNERNEARECGAREMVEVVRKHYLRFFKGQIKEFKIDSEQLMQLWQLTQIWREGRGK